MDVHNLRIVYQFLVFVFVSAADRSEVSIVGGRDVKKLQSWMVSVQKNQHHLCGGILIKDRWVLTAAHCFQFPENINSVKVLLGTLSLSNLKKGSQHIDLIDYEYPETFSMETKEHDIMLLKLSKKVKVKPKELSKKEPDIRAGAKCVVMGWGRIDSKVVKASDKLQMLEVKVVDRKQCNNFYKNDPVITSDMLCAESKEEHRGTCSGDSGGPLECQKNIVGIVSGARRCGDPTVYTFLSKYHISWINSVIRKQVNNTTF